MKKENIADIYSLSPLQKGMLFHSLYAPDSGSYIEQRLCTIRGKLDEAMFLAAWQKILNRHTALRTIYVWENMPEPHQIVLKNVDLKLHTEDWCDVPKDQLAGKLDVWLKEDRVKGFKLKEAPLMRMALFQFSENQAYFIWSFHHLLLDGWSLALVLQEMIGYLQALENGESLELATPPPYREYIAWTKKLDQQKAADFWKGSLNGYRNPTPLPLAKESHRWIETEDAYNEIHLKLSEEETGNLNAFVREHQLSVNNVLQAAWSLLLSRYSGESTVVFGTLLAGRPVGLRDSDKMIGLFTNLVPFRVNIDPDKKVLAWIKEIREKAFELLEYEHSPLIDIHDWTGIPHGKSMFDTFLSFENFPWRTLNKRETLTPVDGMLSGEGGNIEILDVSYIERTNFPLCMMVVPGPRLMIRMPYDSNLYSGKEGQQIAGHFRQILTNLVSSPYLPVGKVETLGEAELMLQLEDWNDTEYPLPFDRCIHHLLEDQARKTPHATALWFEDRKFTYLDLNSLANKMAHALSAKEIGAGDIIGLLADRTPEFIATVLAIFKAGAAYLPLDPSHPADRLSNIIGQSQIRLLITSSTYAAAATAAVSDTGVEIRDIAEIHGPEHSAENPHVPIEPQSLAYIIFTSGSTGKPKGAMISHRGMLNHMSAKIKDLPLDEQSVVSQDAAQTFDISVWQFFAALLVGGSVRIFPEEIARQPVRLMEEVARTRCSVLEIVPSFLGVMLSEIKYRNNEAPNFSALRVLLSSGEILSPEMARQWFEVFPDVPMLNMWGATECSDDVTHERMTSPPATDVTRLRIGKPIINMKVYILDPQMRPVPVGVAGEIYVGGVGVGLGYLNNPEATAKAFVSHTFPGKATVTLYKTGDLARFTEDGNILFIGRADFQVKVRGYRIELGEIEVALNKQESVAEALVLAWTDPGQSSEDARLVAYLKPDVATIKLDEDKLRESLAASLPSYMVPAQFIQISEFPLTINGKIDRKNLPKPPVEVRTPENLTLPRTETEEMVARFWKELLKRDTIGIHQNFFELGGHSLMATQVTSRVKDETKVQLPIRALFEFPTIAMLASEIELKVSASVFARVGEQEEEREEFEI